MYRKWVVVSAAALVGLIGSVNLAQAAPKPLLGVDSSGNSFSSGWTWEVADAVAGQVNLVFIRTDDNGAFYFEKDAVISNNDAALVIRFAPIAGETQAPLVIADEAVHNNTGVDWTGFRMIITATSGTFSFGTTNGSTVGNPDSWRIDPFTTASFTNGMSDMTLGGGTVAAGTTWFPGAASSVGLTLNVSGNQAFELKEIPIVNGGNPGPGPVIPLPASVWTGLSGLVGLGLLSAAKKARHHLA